MYDENKDLLSNLWIQLINLIISLLNNKLNNYNYKNIK